MTRKGEANERRRGKIIRARTRGRVKKLKRRLEADGVAESMRSFVLAAIAKKREMERAVKPESGWTENVE